MNKKSIFTNFGFLSLITIFAAILAGALIYVEFMDDLIHTLSMIFIYILFLILIITIGIAFKKGLKEIVKAAAASLFTVSLFFHAMAFSRMMGNFYYLLSGETILTIIGIGVIMNFTLLIIAYIIHYAINSTNNSNTKLVNVNKVLLFIVGILSLVIAYGTYYEDNKIGRNYEWYLILNYTLQFFVTLILISVEAMIDMFRQARMEGKLDKVITKTVGKKAAKINKTKSKKK